MASTWWSRYRMNTVKTIDESLDAIVTQMQETNELLRTIADRISWISGER